MHSYSEMGYIQFEDYLGYGSINYDFSKEKITRETFCFTELIAQWKAIISNLDRHLNVA